MTLRLFFIILLIAGAELSIAVETSIHTPEGSEQKLILDTLQDGLKRFPELYSLDFQYKRVDVKIPSDIKIIFIVHHFRSKDNWAWIEVELKDYCCSPLLSLLKKEVGRWTIQVMVNPLYAVCPDSYEECIDMKGYIYKRVRERFPSIPVDIFPEVNTETRGILMTLSNSSVLKDIPDTVFVIRRLKLQDNQAPIEVIPRSADGMNQYEPLKAVLYKDKGKWKIKAFESSDDN